MRILSPRLCSLVALALLPLTPAVHGQAFNVDVGSPTLNQPAGPYRAAGAQSGHWNSFGNTGNVFPHQQNLTDVAGNATSVTLELIPASGGNPALFESWSNSQTVGSDSALMDDFFKVEGTTNETRVVFRNLAPGAYAIFTYANHLLTQYSWATYTSCLQSSEPTLLQYGQWIGIHAHQLSYVRHTANTQNGTIELRLAAYSDGFTVPQAFLNGLQVVPLDNASVGTTYCDATLNSTGNRARISASGSASVAADDLILEASSLPTGQATLFYYGHGFVQVPFGEGYRCVSAGGAGVARAPLRFSSAAGEASWSPDYDAPPSPDTRIFPGNRWCFQAWHRDPQGGGSRFNLTDALRIRFLP